MSIHAKPVLIPAGNQELSARLYLPRGVNRPPVLLMAHGFGRERRQCLPGYAWHFADRGIAVLVFDYRAADEAGVRPRQQVRPRRHLEDYAAALAFVRGHPELDGERIALWGINLSGGHALVTAARHADAVRAVVVQSPHVDGAFRSDTFPAQLSRGAFWHASLALMGAGLAQPDIGIPVPDRRGPRPRNEGPVPGAGDPRWGNSMPARVRISVPGYRPIRTASQVRCPTLVITPPGAGPDEASALARMCQRMPDCRLVRLEATQRLAGSGDDFRRLVQLQAGFLCDALAIPPLPAAPCTRGRSSRGQAAATSPGSPRRPAGRTPGAATPSCAPTAKTPRRAGTRSAP